MSFQQWCEAEGVDPEDPSQGDLDAWFSYEMSLAA